MHGSAKMTEPINHQIALRRINNMSRQRGAVYVTSARQFSEEESRHVRHRARIITMAQQTKSQRNSQIDQTMNKRFGHTHDGITFRIRKGQLQPIPIKDPPRHQTMPNDTNAARYVCDVYASAYSTTWEADSDIYEAEAYDK